MEIVLNTNNIIVIAIVFAVTIILCSIFIRQYISDKEALYRNRFEGNVSNYNSEKDNLLHNINKTHREIMDRLSREREDLRVTKNSIISEYNKKTLNFEREKRDFYLELSEKRKLLEKEKADFRLKEILHESRLGNILKSSNPFKIVASMYSDAESIIFDQASDYLEDYRGAHKSAEIVKNLKHKYRELLENYKELQYKYEYMLAQFPELTNYIEEHSYEIISGTDDDDYDHVRNWLSKEEYDSLSEDERNQRALDNWLNGHKRTNSEVGYDYEMYIGYRYRTSPYYKWKVEQYGISKGLNDLGRDIIATREDPETGNTIVDVVQCKYWSQEKKIHENVIAQLFGTAMMYKLEHMGEYSGKGKLIVIPYLMTSTEPSDTAIRFAKLLHVHIRVEPMNEYPRIKCNVNRSTGDKIYHLPFDQQYHNVKIERDDEFYASTVAEAVSKGFRRAHKHIMI